MEELADTMLMQLEGSLHDHHISAEKQQETESSLGLLLQDIVQRGCRTTQCFVAHLLFEMIERQTHAAMIRVSAWLPKHAATWPAHRFCSDSLSFLIRKNDQVRGDFCGNLALDSSCPRQPDIRQARVRIVYARFHIMSKQSMKQGECNGMQEICRSLRFAFLPFPARQPLLEWSECGKEILFQLHNHKKSKSYQHAQR